VCADSWGADRIHDSTRPRAVFANDGIPLQVQVVAVDGAALHLTTPCHACRTILKFTPALWTFVAVKNVEPTNDAAERALRRAVVWWWRSFGAQSMDPYAGTIQVWLSDSHSDSEFSWAWVRRSSKPLTNSSSGC